MLWSLFTLHLVKPGDITPLTIEDYALARPVKKQGRRLSDRLFILAVIFVVAKVFYEVGKIAARARMRRAEELYKKAAMEPDQEKRVEMIIEANDLAYPGGPITKAFKEIFGK